MKGANRKRLLGTGRRKRGFEDRQSGNVSMNCAGSGPMHSEGGHEVVKHREGRLGTAREKGQLNIALFFFFLFYFFSGYVLLIHLSSCWYFPFSSSPLLAFGSQVLEDDTHKISPRPSLLKGSEG